MQATEAQGLRWAMQITRSRRERKPKNIAGGKGRLMRKGGTRQHWDKIFRAIKAEKERKGRHRGRMGVEVRGGVGTPAITKIEKRVKRSPEGAKKREST